MHPGLLDGPEDDVEQMLGLRRDVDIPRVMGILVIANGARYLWSGLG